MDLLYSRCAGLDVHPRSVSACTRIVVDGKVVQEVRTFGTSTRELSEMADWLASVGCTQVAMESTGVYWKPVWHVLEGRFERRQGRGLDCGPACARALAWQLRASRESPGTAGSDANT
jgi:Transposase